MPRNGREQINIALDPERKEEWKRALEETSRYDTLSNLIRESVNHELVRIGFKEGVEVEIPDEKSTKVDVDLSSIENEISEMKNELRSVTQRVEQISLATDAQQDTELMELASELHEELPRLESTEELSKESPNEIVAWEGQSWRLAQDVGESDYDVTRALALLEQQMSRVKSKEVIADGSPRNVYYVKQ